MTKRAKSAITDCDDGNTHAARAVLLDPINLGIVPNLLLLTVAHELGVIAPTPLWLVLGSMILAHACALAFATVYPLGTTRSRPREFLFLSTGLCGAVLYITGWGAVFSVGLVAAAAVVIFNDGSRYGRTAMLAIAVTIVAGETAVALGIVSSMIPERVSYGVAFLELVMTVHVVGLVTRGQREKELAEEREQRGEERFRALVQFATDAILVIEDGGRVLYASPAVENVLGVAPDELVSFDLEWIDPDHVDAVIDVWLRLRQNPGSREALDVPLRQADGSSRWVEVHLANLTESPAVRGYVCNLRDIGERRVAQDQLIHDAQHDSLTQLSNRRGFLARLDEVWQDLTPDDLSALVFIDVDNFKSINDRYGHEIGDEALLLVSETISRLLRPSDLVARYGGDEFTAFLCGLPDTATAFEVVERITERLSGSFRIRDHDVPMSVSTGVTTVSGRGKSVADMVRDADYAMYQAKRGGRARWQLFEDFVAQPGAPAPSRAGS
jgi:diguanylate cyclase (GGDEF)-like protein/PAS domain S-box-containing protein